MNDVRRELGQWGERIAEAYLLQKGLRIEERNYRTARGEIDLVAWEGDVLVFVEVRTRTSMKYGSALESITRQKKKKLREMALAYLQAKTKPSRPFRFDVVGIQYQDRGGEAHTGQTPVITHIEHAF
ncbi:YraN family protein [Brevibacillus borstelensis]|uniref:YraN family protein n=1 Tax=Brevibacillus borstelensis TaxID=45462 RepID=UPI0030BC2D6E